MDRQSFSEFIDSQAGADGIRLWLLLIAAGAYLIPSQHRAELCELGKNILAINIPLLFVWVFFPPVWLLYYVFLWLLGFSLKCVDAVSFRLPRRLLRYRLGAAPAFWCALGLQICLLSAAGVYARRELKERARMQRPARFGPAVLKRLGGRRAYFYQDVEGKVRPLLTPSESLRVGTPSTRIEAKPRP